MQCVFSVSSESPHISICDGHALGLDGGLPGYAAPFLLQWHLPAREPAGRRSTGRGHVHGRHRVGQLAVELRVHLCPADRAGGGWSPFAHGLTSQRWRGEITSCWGIAALWEADKHGWVEHRPRRLPEVLNSVDQAESPFCGNSPRRTEGLLAYSKDYNSKRLDYLTSQLADTLMFKRAVLISLEMQYISQASLNSSNVTLVNIFSGRNLKL